MTTTFRKEVIKPGTYYPRGADGKPFKEVVTLDRIRHWSRETNRLIKNGNRVPMPYVHTDDAVPFLTKDPPLASGRSLENVAGELRHGPRHNVPLVPVN